MANEPKPSGPAMVSIPSAQLDALIARIDSLEKSQTKGPEPKKFQKPTYDFPALHSRPVAAGHKRIRIKMVRGAPVTKKARLVDDTTETFKEANPEQYRCHGFLYAGEVVDVDAKAFKAMRDRHGDHLLDLDIIEETTKHVTRPLFWPNEATAMTSNPYRKVTREKALADIERVQAAIREGASKG